MRTRSWPLHRPQSCSIQASRSLAPTSWSNDWQWLPVSNLNCSKHKTHSYRLSVSRCSGDGVTGVAHQQPWRWGDDIESGDEQFHDWKGGEVIPTRGARQVIAGRIVVTVENIPTQAGSITLEIDTGQAGAGFERPVPNAGDAVGIVTLVRLSFPENAPSPMLVTGRPLVVLGMTTTLLEPLLILDVERSVGVSREIELGQHCGGKHPEQEQ